MNDQTQQAGPAAEAGWQKQIREACVERGWDDGELARRAGISRSTLYYLRQGTTQRPRAKTLNGIARALEIDPRSLCSQADESSAADELSVSDSTGAEHRFDRLTNPLVDEVRREHPEMFAGWNQADWEELYSVFGTGGRLTEEGVAETAEQMNRRRETVRRLQIIMETHLADVAERLVETLFEMTRPQSNLAESAQLQELLSGLGNPSNLAVGQNSSETTQ